MRKNFYYIFIICAFTRSFAENEEKELLEKETDRYERHNLEEEARQDLTSLLSDFKKYKASEESDDENINTRKNINLHDNLMEKIDEIVDKDNTRREKERKRVRSERFNQLNHRSVGDNTEYPNYNVHWGNNWNVNYVDIKPEVYPLPMSGGYGTTEKSKVGAKSSKNVNNFDETKNLKRKSDIGNSLRTTAELVFKDSSSLINRIHQVNEILNPINFTLAKSVPTRKEIDHNNIDIVQEFMRKLYEKSLRTSDSLENNNDNSENITVRKKINKRRPSITVLRTDIDDENLKKDIDDQLDSFLKMDIGRHWRDLQNSVENSKPVIQSGSGTRTKRATQAGYTQDPDVCKVYNENLIKLWHNLSKYTNVTEQPDESALHNIALIIQAYLEHQNRKQPLYSKTKHESKDTISEVIHQIKKHLEATAEASPETITFIITKYLKPDYEYDENPECLQINEEALKASVDLLFKNYLDNIECENVDYIGRNKKIGLRKKTAKVKTLSSDGLATHSITNHDIQPNIQTIIVDHELYSDYQKGKIQRQLPVTKSRRVSKRRSKLKSRLIQRSSNKNISKKSKRTNDLSKPVYAKILKKPLNTYSTRTRCEGYATRTLEVSLRPVIERFMSLLECQLDNTLRSEQLVRVSNNPYYLYASKSNNKDSQRQGRNLPASKMKEKKLGKKITKKINIKHRDNSFVENDQDTFESNVNSEWISKYDLGQSTAAHKYATSAVINDLKNVRGHHSGISLQNSKLHYPIKVFLQSPPLYDDYVGVYKTHYKTNSNSFSSIVKPMIYITDKKNTIKNKVTGKKSALSDIELKENMRDTEYGIFYEDVSPAKLSQVLNANDEQTDTSYAEFPFIYLTKLKHDDELMGTKSKKHLQSSEVITEFLKRAHDESLKTPEIAVPYALDTNKGYVELTHLVKYPKVLVYRPQFLVKNTMPYDDFLKIISNFNMTNDEVRLIKIVRHLPDSSVQVLFSTQDFEAPLEVRNINENKRRTSSLKSTVNNHIDTIDSNTKIDSTRRASKRFVHINRPIGRSDTDDENVTSDIPSGSDEDISLYLDPEYLDSETMPWGRMDKLTRSIDLKSSLDTLTRLKELSTNPKEKSDLESLRQNEELSDNPELDINSNSSDSSSGISSLPITGLITNASSEDTQTAIGTGTGLDTASNSSNIIIKSSISFDGGSLADSNSVSLPNLDPNLSSQSHLSQSDSLSNSAFDSQLNSDSSNLNSDANSLPPPITSKNPETDAVQHHSPIKPLLGWWRLWKHIIDMKLKQIIGKMASLANRLDKIVAQ